MSDPAGRREDESPALPATLLELGDLRLSGWDVALRPLALNDAGLLAVAAAESRESYGFTPVPQGRSEARRYVEQALQQRGSGQRYPFAVERHGLVVGSTSFMDFQPWRWPDQCARRSTDRPDALEIGYTWLAGPVQRTSCNTMVKFLLLKHAFEAWDVLRVSFRTDERNHRSRRAIERIGARLDGVLRADRPGADCSIRNSACYSILAPEWPEIRAALLQRIKAA